MSDNRRTFRIVRSRKRKIFRIIWFSLVSALMIWHWTTFQSRNLPLDTFESTGTISVTENEDKITFSPIDTDKTIEVIFFQGGLTDPKAYAPLCRQIAGNGFTCHLIKMTWRAPIFDYQKITKLFILKSGQYVIGGHSQGGKMASQFVYENRTLMKGLFLLGTSHPKLLDLSKHEIPTIKLYGENDGLASVEKVMENKDKLPRNSKLFLIRGGNHSQFGYLGGLLLDDAPDISLEEQQQITVQQLTLFLTEIQVGLQNR